MLKHARLDRWSCSQIVPDGPRLGARFDSIGSPYTINARAGSKAIHFLPGCLTIAFGAPSLGGNNASPVRLYYGLFRKQIYMLFFDRSDSIRFTHSPSGGGVKSL
jgi:hypothetical protein